MSTIAEELAHYFTGRMVAHHSVGLQLGGAQRRAAEDFFRMRKELGIEGWTRPDEALLAVERKLREHAHPRESDPGRVDWTPESDDVDPDDRGEYLLNATPGCKHEVYAKWGGVKCRRCPGWFCY